MAERIEYLLRITFNGRRLNRVIIDRHYRGKHAGSMNDALILELVKTQDGAEVELDEVKNGIEYYKIDRAYFSGKAYRLILLLEPSKSYLGVVNAFRVKG